MRRICNILIYLFLAILAVVAGILVIPTLLGCKNMAVVSGSMSPEIPVGSVVVVKEVTPKELTVGDVITFQMSGSNVTHRITAIDMEGQQVTTKGDANDSNDPSPVAFTSIIGRMVFHLPWMGYLSIYLRTPLGIAGISGVILILLLLNMLPDIFDATKKGKTSEMNEKIH